MLVTLSPAAHVQCLPEAKMQAPREASLVLLDCEGLQVPKGLTHTDSMSFPSLGAPSTAPALPEETQMILFVCFYFLFKICVLGIWGGLVVGWLD